MIGRAFWQLSATLSMRELASTLGLPPRALYRYYPDRAALEAAIAEEGYPPERLGEIVWRALTTPHPPVRYGYAAVPHPLRNWIIPRLLPKRRVDALIAKNLGWKRK